MYRPQRSWGKVIFSQASVCDSVHRGGVAIPACIAGGIQACLAAGLGGWYPSMRCRFPGPQPTGKFRAIWSRPTAKGEVEGDLFQVHTQGGSWGGSGWGGVCSWGWGWCLVQGVPAPGGCLLRGLWRAPRDGYYCGRYASYWNAFLFNNSPIIWIARIWYETLKKSDFNRNVFIGRLFPLDFHPRFVMRP